MPLFSDVSKDRRFVSHDSGMLQNCFVVITIVNPLRQYIYESGYDDE